jgi:hypothetical protein
MLIDYHLGQTSIVVRFKIRNSSVSTGAGLTGLTSASSGLKISTIADNESTATTYTAGGSTIETITTLGTYAAPTATKCRFKEVDSTNHPGVYEAQIADARFAVASSKSLLVSVSGATNAAECDFVIPLRSVDPYDGVRGGMTSLANAAAGAAGGLWILGTNAPAATTLTGIAASGGTPASDALKLTGGAASTTSGGTAGRGFYSLGGAGAATTNGAASGTRFEGGGTTTVSGGRGLHLVGTGTSADLGVEANGMSGNIHGVLDTVTTYTGNTPQTGDTYARLGAPAGASVSADIAAIKSDTGTILTDVNSGAGAIYTRIGAPAGASIAADIASVKTSVGAVTGNVGGNVTGSVGSVAGNVAGNVVGSVGSVTNPVTVGTNNDKTGYSLTQAFPSHFANLVINASGLVQLDLTQALSAARALDSVADTSLTLNDAMHCAVAAEAGKESVVGTTYTVKTPSTGTTLRTFTLDSGSAPTSRT